MPSLTSCIIFAGNYVADTATTTQQKTAEAAEALKDTAVNVSNCNTQPSFSGILINGGQTILALRCCETLKCIWNVLQGAQAARDTAARAYDATADTLGSAKDRVMGTPEPEPTYTQRAADAARSVSLYFQP